MIQPTKQLFDGQLRVYSTCRDCGEIMQVTNPDDKVHPGCTPRLTLMESLLAGWLSTVEAGDHEAEMLTLKEIEELESRPIDFGSAAVQYANQGWPVFPLARHSKLPAVSKAKGGQGFKDAKTDADRIARWWKRHPEHNIGLATGHLFDVVDVDKKNGGIESFHDLLNDRTIEIDCHGIAFTASGGLHLYVPATGKGCFQSLRPGIDYRGRGGYCVSPPSTLGGPGRSYSWLCEPSPALKGDGK
jgi:Bifunctional DNA primase/polymerase, N-terminal